jgi:lysozyme
MLVDNWRRVVALSISFWMQVFGLVVLIAPELWFLLTGQDYDPHLAWMVGVGLNVAGLVGRLWQQGVSPWWEWIRIISVAFILLALSFLIVSQQTRRQCAPGLQLRPKRSIWPFPSL